MANDRERNDLRAKAAADQVTAALRDEGPLADLPDNLNICAAAAHTLDPNDYPEPLRTAIRNLQRGWARRHNVTPYEERNDLDQPASE